jgi:hypothetical protein
MRRRADFINRNGTTGKGEFTTDLDGFRRIRLRKKMQGSEKMKIGIPSFGGLKPPFQA